MSKTLVILAFICACAGALAPFVAWEVHRSSGSYMRMINEVDPETLAKNRLTWREGDDPAVLYGAPTELREWVVWYDEYKIIDAPEARERGEHWLLTSPEHQPVQTRTLWTVTRFACALLLLAGGIFFFAAGVLAARRKA